MVNYEITKKEMLAEQNNDMCHNYYFLVHGRIYNEDKTRYRKFKYIEWFDIFDVMEFFDIDRVTKEDVKEYLNNLENCYLTDIKEYNDIQGLKQLYKYCNETIENYNKLACYWGW